MTLICPDLSLEGCARRLDRLRRGMEELGAGAAVLHEPDVIRRAVGCTSLHGWPATLVVIPDEAIAFVYAGGEPASIATEVVVMQGIRRDRAVRHDKELAAAAASRLASLVGNGKPVAIDTSGAPGWIVSGLAEAGARTVDLANLLIRLRRRKDADELAIIEHNVAIADLALGTAAVAVKPGATELDVYQAMREAVDSAAGTSVAFGGDFMAGPGGGEAGGPPSTRILAAGDSFVIDYFPTRGGYWADMCRTYPIGDPSPRLAEAMRVTAEALDLAETIVRPGVPVVELDKAVRAHQATWERSAGDYFHLTGHSVGLRPHEAPWIATDSDDVFEAGDVLAVEPAAYLEDLRGGVRIEDNYVVTDDGVRRLSRLRRKGGRKMEPVCYVHGEWVPASEAKVSLFDSGLMYGETITETLRTFRRQPYEIDRHLARFRDSCRIARIAIDPAIDLAGLLAELAERNANAFDPEDELLLKLDVTRGIFGYYREPGRSYDDFTLLLHPIRLPFHRFAASYENGISVVYPHVRQQSSQTLDARVKHRSRLYQAIAEREAADMEPGAAPLLLDLSGRLAEGTGWNLFVVQGGVLRTPTTEATLAGISRAVVIDLATELGLGVSEEDVWPYDLATADEAFATATSSCLLPITRAHGRTVGDGRPGPIAKRLLAAWSDRVGMDIPGQARQRAPAQDPALADRAQR